MYFNCNLCYYLANKFIVSHEELLFFYQVPSLVVDRRILTRYGLAV
jgi:hypothetical protein